MPRFTLRRFRGSSPAPRNPKTVALSELLERRLCLSAAAFLPPVSYAPGVPAVSVATGDFNNDYNEDVALAGANGIYVLAGKGDGTFGPPVQVSTDTGAATVVAEDLNGDGNRDLVAANPGDGTLTLLLGKGDGTFGAPVQVAAVAGVRSIAFGQFNTNFDGGFITGGGSGIVPVSSVNGVGKSTAIGVPVPTPLPAPSPGGDYNNEDIVVAGAGGLAVLRAQSDGTYAAPQVIHAGSYQSVVTDDFDDDGNTDLAATTGGQVQVFSGKGDGTFNAPASYTVTSSPAGATTLVAGDFNGDYVDDLAVATPGDNAVAILLSQTDADGNALGTFAAPVSVPVGASPTTVAVGDLNGDDNDDLVAATAGGAVVITGNGDGTFAGPATSGGSLNPAAVALDDFNGDGFLDLASADPAGGAAVQLQSVPDVGVTLTAPTSAPIHGNLTYTITVHNAGPTDSAGVSLSDYLPTDATLVSATASQGTVDTSAGSEVNVDLGNLSGGASATVTVVIQPQDYGSVSNSATISSASPDGNWDNNFAYADTQIVGTSGAEVGITQTATGGEIFLPIDRPISQPILRITGRPVPVAVGASTGAVTTGTVSAGGVGTVASTGTISSTGTVTSGGASGSANGNGGTSVAVPPIEPIVPIDPLPPIWWGGFIKVGDNVTYTLTVTNNGPETAAGLTVNDTLPANTSLVSATPSQGTADTTAAGAVKFALGDLASGASATITLVVKTEQVGTITNAASVSSATADPFTDNNSSSVSRYVTDTTSPPYPEPLAGPIAWNSGGAVYAAGAGAAANGVTLGSAGGTLAALPAGAVAKSAAPSQITIGDVKLKEGKNGTKNAVFTVTRKGNRKGTATVHFATADSTAKAGSDYVAGAGMLTFAPGVKKLKVMVPVKSTGQAGTNKSFMVNLSSATNAAVARSAATGTIVHPAKKTKGGAKSGPIHINFQPAAAATPTGFLADTGAVFGPRGGSLSYGWSTDNTSAAAQRSGVAGRAGSTYNVLHAGDKWEIALPNGKYKVQIAAGGKVNAEGTGVVTGKSTAARPFADGTRTITVSDGRLTLTDGAGAADVKIALVDITRVGSAKSHKHGN